MGWKCEAFLGVENNASQCFTALNWGSRDEAGQKLSTGWLKNLKPPGKIEPN